MGNLQSGIGQLMSDSFYEPESILDSESQVHGFTTNHSLPFEKTYLKRYRMELDFNPTDYPTEPNLPENYTWQEWSWKIQEAHAEVLFDSFHHELDCKIFRSFHTPGGCSSLMRDLCQRAEFVPQATWLISNSEGACGTIQAVLQKGKTLAIQNVGVVPLHRGKGLGKALLQKLMSSLTRYNLNKITLEVTSENLLAINLYRGLGFRKTKIIYKEILFSLNLS